jgi:hypothetical protein
VSAAEAAGGADTAQISKRKRLLYGRFGMCAHILNAVFMVAPRPALRRRPRFDRFVV